MRRSVWHVAYGVLIVASLLVLDPAWALTLEEAKAAGVVGEQPNGYLGVVRATPEAQSLVSEINRKRRQAYEDIARRNGTKLSDVETLAGEKAIQNTKPGLMIQAPSGQWTKK